MAIQQALEKLGLTINEIKVYLALIDLSTSFAGKIAEKAKLHRRPTYDAIQRLIEKGLASYVIVAGKKLFNPVNPEKLIDIVRERERELEAVMPEIVEKFKRTESKMHAEIYEGADGLKSVMDMILKEKTEWYTIGSTGKAPMILPYYLEQFAKKRVKLGIKRKVLLVGSREGRDYYKILKKQGNAQIKFFPDEIKQPQTIWIFGSKVAIILVSLENPTTFLIDSREIAHSYREYFHLLWKKVDD